MASAMQYGGPWHLYMPHLMLGLACFGIVPMGYHRPPLHLPHRLSGVSAEKLSAVLSAAGLSTYNIFAGWVFACLGLTSMGG